MIPPRYREFDTDEREHGTCHLCAEAELHRTLYTQRERAIEALIAREIDEEDMRTVAALVRVFNRDIALLEAPAAEGVH